MQNEDYKYIATLIKKYRGRVISEKEKVELEEWCKLSDDNRRLFERLTNDVYKNMLLSIDVKKEARKIKRMVIQRKMSKFLRSLLLFKNALVI